MEKVSEVKWYILFVRAFGTQMIPPIPPKSLFININESF